MKDSAALVRGWMRKGDSDLADVRRTLASEGPFDTACFHAQQAVEKYLKALLALHGMAIPRTHDLEEIQKACVAVHKCNELAALDLSDLTGYAVELRYDAEFWPEQQVAREAHNVAQQVRNIVCSLLPEHARP